jgi:hypothetical protein
MADADHHATSLPSVTPDSVAPEQDSDADETDCRYFLPEDRVSVCRFVSSIWSLRNPAVRMYYACISCDTHRNPAIRTQVFPLCSRMTRWVCENVGQNVAQPIFCRLLRKLNCGKSRPNMPTTFVIFKKAAQSKQSPNGRKFAQSGHPALQLKGLYV